MQPTQKQFLAHWKTEIVSSVIVVLCLILVYLFPADNSFQAITKSLFFFLLLPILYIKLILRQSLDNFGFSLQNPKVGFSWVIGMLFISFLIILILIKFFNFENNYLIPAYLAENFRLFLLYELIMLNFILFIYEFFFKGFILFSLSQKFGWLVVPIQALIFILFLFFTSTIDWKLAPAIILSVTGGIVAYKSHSFVYSYLMSLLFMIFLDAYIIYIFK
ncbi:MAG: hypothetical protein COX30_04525 [Candidatus Moranbacteria bacterium CG23_combo_of_CG06-09_8_20_14_all_39_10]|nr:MAG: hypothetical protein COX30_04525 [Candidatus Moranbacteria bacterium CG23_combo_of_CG06-09_8_20_14_all_39_10]